MNQKLSEQIEQTEQKWLPTLRNEVNRIFSYTNIPSHDFSHHLRVWNYSKELLYADAVNNYTNTFIESLMLAVFFHDTGLSETADESHGLAGCIHFEKFAKSLNLENSLLYNDIRQAIINHDNKNYNNSSRTNTPPGIYHFLTVADDLDAFGALGLMRYFEIYCHRNIPAEEIEERIYRNMQSRFQFVGKFIGSSPELYTRHEKRYQTGLAILKNLKMHEITLLTELIAEGLFISQLAEKKLNGPGLQHLIAFAKQECCGE